MNDVLELIKKYDDETKYHSFFGPMQENPSFKKIIEEGKNALPETFDVAKAKNAWLDWGQKEKII